MSLNSLWIIAIGFLFLGHYGADPNGVFWHISDFHLNDKYYNMKECYEGHHFANYNCDSSRKLVDNAFQFLKKETEKEKPDFISLTGDNTPHLDGLDRDFTMKTIQHMTDAYNMYIDHTIPFIPVVGNHEVFPANQMSPDPNVPLSAISWCKDLKKIWGPYIDEKGEQPQANFSIGCYFSTYLKDKKLLITSINGLIWYANNPYAKPKQNDTLETYDPLGQFAWLEKLYEWARIEGVSVINTNHFPLGASISEPDKFANIWDLPNKKMIALIKKYRDVIKVNLVAHEHVDSFRILFDEHEPISMFLLAPSITPFRFKDFGAFNPRLRKVEYNRQTGELINYHQYYLNITDGDSIAKGWQYDYNFLKRYNQTELSPKSLANIVRNFVDYDDYQKTWSNYWDAELGHTVREGSCAKVPERDSICRCMHICSFLHAEFEELKPCLKVCKSKDVINSGKVIFTVLLVIVVVTSAVMLIFINRRSFMRSNEREDTQPIVHEDV